MQPVTSPSRFRLVGYMLLLSLIYFTLTRAGLSVWSWSVTNASLLDVLHLLLVGLVYDLSFYAYAAILPVLYLFFLPDRWWRSRFNSTLTQGAFLVSIYGLGFVAVAEFLFWEEFSVRFNFISVDYLVYSREVIDNINQSYPLPLLLGSIFIVTVLVFGQLRPGLMRILATRESFWKRAARAIAWLVLPLAAYGSVNQDLQQFSTNNYQNELAANGPYQFISAFKNNELNYEQFYISLPPRQISDLLKQEVAEANGTFTSNDLYQIRRYIDNPGEEKRLNIMLIMVESLSADYLGVFGNLKGLTPNLDQISGESLFFTRMYATGTRTTRGLEAVTLSIPPTPGRSIVKRIGHESNMWSLGNVLKDKSYDVRFLYGGRGYFDNMNAFFSGNGYQVLDQFSVPDKDMVFTNAWGMSDEDLYTQAIHAADQASESKQPFFFHLMTTSNHRPYTYPEGRIEIPSGSGRSGAVRYTDWAIGDFLKRAKEKPWFKDTLFVIVADHCAHSAGKTDLPVNRYHIPLIIYAPGQITPKKVGKLASQIDLAPTLLGMLNMDYTSTFFGRNIFTTPENEERALIGNYQKLGFYQSGRLSILIPKKGMILQEHPESGSPEIITLKVPDEQARKNIAYYQGASYIYNHQLNFWGVATP
jgi:phosphoglycerol transferase MdoB-like AlkP superfamily enzyme